MPAGQESFFTLPKTKGPNGELWGLKSHDGSTCLFIENGIFSMYNDEKGKFEFQATVSRNFHLVITKFNLKNSNFQRTGVGKETIKFSRKNDHLFFEHGDKLRRIVHWSNNGLLYATFNEKSEFILTGPTNAMIVDGIFNSYILYTLLKC